TTLPATHPLSLHDALPILDPAVGRRRLSLDAVRPRKAGASADGLGHRRDDPGRAMGRGAARQRLAHAAPADGGGGAGGARRVLRSEEHTSELQSLAYLVCR